MTKPFDPLKWIPTADAVRRRIVQIQKESRRLGILLKTAEEIERTENRETGESRKGTNHASK
jgi:hypothetical protein